ncbi:MAG: hypothetical protein SPI72_00715 [Porphyromonas sp.]|nr:hypothetical protein [Porphyromonas sp.]
MHINNIRATAETIPTNEVTQESPQSIVAPESIQGEQVATVSVDTHSEQDVAENILSQSKGDKEIAIEAAKFDVRQAEKELKKLSSEVPKEIQSREEFIAYKLQKRGELAQLQERIQKLNSVVQLLEKETSDINDAQIEQPIDQKTELISEHEERQGRNLDEQPKSSDAVSSQVGPTDLDSDVQQPQGFRRIQEEDGQVPEFQRGDANTQTGEQPLKDKQGNAIDSEGRLVVDEIAHMSELTDEDFTTPTRSVLLPPIPKNVDEAIGANGKRVIIKKNILDKNNKTHRFTPEQSRSILSNALYNPNIIGQTQPRERANHWVAIKIDEKSPITILEVNSTKDNVEVVGWYTLDKRNLDRIKRQAEREGGELLILTPNDRVESLSTPTSDLPSASEGTKEKEYSKDATAADVITNQVSKEINKRQKQYQRLVDQLRKTGLALDVIDSQETYDKKLKEVAENKGTTFRDLKGRVYGFANNETVYIDPSKMDLNTPIHEFTHLWYSAMKSKDPELVKRGLELVKRTKYYREVKNSSEYQGLSEEQILDEALAHALGDLGEKQVAKKGIIRTKLGLWVKEFFDKLRSLFGVESDVDMYDFADMVLSDLLSGKSIGSAKENGTRFRMSDEQEQIKQQALANGSFMKAPNGEPSNLNEHQWTQVRTKAFKNWFGDWEKSARIEKLRKAEPVVLQGNEHEGKYELNGKSAQGYILSTLRGEYTNKDTGDVIRITRKGAEKVTRHDAESDVHLRSIASIPQMIENATFIEEVDNDKSKNGFSTYRYYVVGLRIDDVDYTAKLVVGVASNGDTYYDHALTEIEKGNLISAIDPIKRGFGTEEATLSEVKDKRLLSILQTDASKVVDENGEPMVVYHGTSVNGRRFFKFKEDLPIWFTPSLQYSKAFSLDNNKPVIYPSFIRSKNMVYVGNIDGVVDDRSVKLLSELSGLPVGKIQQIAADTKADYLYQITNSEQFKYLISSNGYDGISAREGGVLSYAVFSPTQIKSATENIGTFDQENPDIRFRIGERRKADMRAGLLNKLTNATEEQVERTIAEIEKLGESTKEGGNPKLEKVAFHWAKKGTIILPEDNDKVIHAVKLSESFKVDPIKYNNPMEIINEYSPDVEYGEPVDPDSIPEFTNKREIGSTGVFVYDVEESEKAQEAVCKIAHAQFGWAPKANLSKQPWCLASFTRKGIPTESAKNFWANTYNSVGKKIAFQDGKVIAFMAHNKGRDVDVWWNLTDDPSYNLPLPSGDYINPDGEIEPERDASSNSDGMEEAIELVAQEISDDDFARILVELYENDQLNNTREIELTAQDKLGEYISENIESFNYELEDYEEEYREERGIDPEDDIDRSEMIERFIESVDAKYGYRPLEFFDDDSVREDFIRQVADSVVSNMNKDERIAVLSDYLDYADGSSEYEQAIQEYQDQRRESNSLRFRANLRNEINLNPSDRQKEAGNYKKAHIRVDGFDVSIETPKGGYP